MSNKIKHYIIILILILISNQDNKGLPSINYTSTISNISLNKTYIYGSVIELDTINCVSTRIYNYTKPKNYKFSYIMRDSSKRWFKLKDNTFQLNPYDRGNYNKRGKLAGTNRSISAKVYEKYTGFEANKDNMKSLSFDLAIKIYEEKFWHKYMNGDSMQVHNPILIDMIFNAICSSAGSHHFKDILQSMTKNYKHTKTGKVYKDGFVIYKSKLKWITLDEIYVFNELCSNIETEEKFYKKFWNKRNDYYNKRSSKKGLKGLSKWIKDYNYNIYNH